MIKQIPRLPAAVLGFEARGTVSKEDYENVLIPAVEQALAEHDEIALLYHLGPDFETFDFGAIWDDAKIGFRHLTAWRKIAVVTDVDWIRSSVRIFGVALPGHVRVFANNALSDAKAWLAE